MTQGEEAGVGNGRHTLPVSGGCEILTMNENLNDDT